MEVKHLKLKAVLTPNRRECIVTVVEQSHFGMGFGASNDFKPSTFRHNGLAITSSRVTAMSYFRGMSGGFTLILPGIPEQIYRSVAIVPIEAWPKIKEAVLAYNDRFSAEGIAKERERQEELKKANTQLNDTWGKWDVRTDNYTYVRFSEIQWGSY